MGDWDARYREGHYEKAPEPHDLVARFGSLIPEGMVIDIASGNGRDIIFLAGENHPVCGLELSREAVRIARERSISQGRSIYLVSGDASALPFRKKSASGVLVFNFLLREIMGEIVELLREGGILMYETLLKRQNKIDRWRSPEYLLEDGELLSYFSALELILYEEVIAASNNKRRAIARYVGRKK